MRGEVGTYTLFMAAEKVVDCRSIPPEWAMRRCQTAEQISGHPCLQWQQCQSLPQGTERVCPALSAVLCTCRSTFSKRTICSHAHAHIVQLMQSPAWSKSAVGSNSLKLRPLTEDMHWCPPPCRPAPGSGVDSCQAKQHQLASYCGMHSKLLHDSGC